MERLTIEYCGEYVPKGLCSIDRQGGADDCELCYENCKAMREGNDDCSGCVVDKCFDKLGKYEDLEEQGKLMKLPCAVGDTVYRINKGAKEPIISMTVLEIGTITTKTGDLVIQIKCRDNADKGETYYFNSDFGKNVFFSEKASENLKVLKREKMYGIM